MDDIKGVLNDAALKRLAMQVCKLILNSLAITKIFMKCKLFQVRLVLDVEAFMPQTLHKAFYRKEDTFYPNKKRNFLRTVVEVPTTDIIPVDKDAVRLEKFINLKIY